MRTDRTRASDSSVHRCVCGQWTWRDRPCVTCDLIASRYGVQVTIAGALAFIVACGVMAR